MDFKPLQDGENEFWKIEYFSEFKMYQLTSAYNQITTLLSHESVQALQQLLEEKNDAN